MPPPIPEVLGSRAGLFKLPKSIESLVTCGTCNCWLLRADNFWCCPVQGNGCETRLVSDDVLIEKIHAAVKRIADSRHDRQARNKEKINTTKLILELLWWRSQAEARQSDKGD